MNDESLRLIEDCLPLETISERAAREKAQRVGNLASLHTWWGRKPLIAARAAVYAALVPAPQDACQRDAYLRQLTALCTVDVPARTLDLARRQIAEVQHERLRGNGQQAGATPLIADLFAGGGSIPLEALRLGCTAVAGDLNPVAYLIARCTLDYPQRYPEISAQVRDWGRRWLSRAGQAVRDLYPALPANTLDLGADSAAGSRPAVYLWTRTVTCPNPQCAAVVPLTPTTLLVDKRSDVRALRIQPQPGDGRVAFQLVEARSRADLDFGVDDLSARGATRCPCCGATVDSNHTKHEGKQGRLGTQLMAVVSRSDDGRQRRYQAAADLPAAVVPDDDTLDARIAALCAASGLSLPHEPIFSGDSRAFFTHLYGIDQFHALFTRRQLLVLLSCIRELHQLHGEMLQQGLDADEARAVTTYLALLIDRLADWNSTLCKWSPTGESLSNTFARQALPMIWNFAETDPFGRGWGNLHDALDRMVETIALLERIPATAEVRRGAAYQSDLADASVDAVVTDPPYYDNVPYADLSDFFYVWLKRSVGQLYPEHFGGDLTPKKQEAYVSPPRHAGDKGAATSHYTAIIQHSLEEVHRILKPAAPLVLVYAHKTTAGWSSIVQALRQARFMVTEAWPISTESRGRVRAQDSAALATSIFIVARKRTASRVGNYARDVLPELSAIVRERVATLSAAAIGGADLVIATVGAGLRAYTRYARVEMDNGDTVDEATFLAEVQRAALSCILEQVVGLQGPSVHAVDPTSQYYVLARYQYGGAEIDFDEANVLARGIGVEISGPGSLTSGSVPLLIKTKKVVQLQDYRARGAARDLGRPTSTPPPLIDILHRLLWLNDHQPAAIGEFLAAVAPEPTSLRLIAEALAGKRLASEPSPGAARDERSEEQKAIGRLLPSWRRIVEAPSQPRLF
ncbi:MAG: DUF1156 domain-containing protein [Oscillochloris sp.]|nr:DUF1156 domain-containing protein [Oscillochloris sp.]